MPGPTVSMAGSGVASTAAIAAFTDTVPPPWGFGLGYGLGYGAPWYYGPAYYDYYGYYGPGAVVYAPPAYGYAPPPPPARDRGASAERVRSVVVGSGPFQV